MSDLDQLRERIRAVDERIVAALAERVELARAVGALKQTDAAATMNPGQEAAVVRRAVEAARRHRLPGEPVRELFWTIIGLCRTAQLEDR